ncbi:hypothetical protein L195_g063339, partial [Trifolium pratense]
VVTEEFCIRSGRMGMCFAPVIGCGFLFTVAVVLQRLVWGIFEVWWLRVVLCSG